MTRLLGLGLSILLLFGTVLLSTLKHAAQEVTPPPVPSVVSSVVTEILEGDQDIAPFFVDTITEETVEDFDYVFMSYMAEYGDHSIESVSDDFCVVSITDPEGNPVNPPVGFWYTLAEDDTKVAEWYIGRLQPLSKYDSEFSQVWEDTHG